MQNQRGSSQRAPIKDSDLGQAAYNVVLTLYNDLLTINKNVSFSSQKYIRKSKKCLIGDS